MRLDGRAALVTGAGSGIGRATAARLLREGARVALTDLDPDLVEPAARDVLAAGGDALARRLDVREESDWESVIAKVVERWGGLDIAVLNAGISFAKPITDTTLEEWRHVHAINLDGVFLGTKHAVAAMRAAGHGGSIVIVSSASGLKASAGASAYASSKGALRSFARSVALECAADGIRVNGVYPAGVVTPMWKSMPFFARLEAEHGGEAGAWTALAAGSPLGRFAEADEIAAGIAFLCSDDASYITGTEMVIDGGYTA